MLFYLTTLGVANFLTEDPPVVSEEETDFNVRAAYDVWHQGDFLCKNYVLNDLENSLYSIFAGTKTVMSEDRAVDDNNQPVAQSEKDINCEIEDALIRAREEAGVNMDQATEEGQGRDGLTDGIRRSYRARRPPSWQSTYI